MERDMLVKILERTPGIKGSGQTYEVAQDHRVTFYIGRPGHAMPLGDVKTFALEDGFVELVTKEAGHFFFVYEAVSGVSVKATETPADRRAGFA